MHRPAAAASVPPPGPSACPYPGASSRSTESNNGPTDAGTSSLNPLNFMFSSLPQTPFAGQKSRLPTERQTSSIPKSDGSPWEYPSPQQMYNAMRRKGYDDAPEDAVESMVEVHNFLNEGAWREIRAWESQFAGGVLGALRAASTTSSSSPATAATPTDSSAEPPRLMRFEGRSKELTPKARVMQLMGRLWPEKYSPDPPFDRHDWYVMRFPPAGEPKTVRYVIDYYSGPPEPTGEPVFYLDVRPAVDRPGAVAERALRWSMETWQKASGSDVRAAEKERKRMRGEGL